MSPASRFLAAAACAAMAWSGSPAAAQESDSTLDRIFSQGKILFDARLRYEWVEQDGFTEDGNGLTFRARFGFESGTFHGFTALVEGDLTRDLIGDFNSTVNGLGQFPVIADPDSTRLNRAQLTFDGPFQTKVTGGRQRIILDNTRFVGNVGFRQNEQTFDAVRVVNTGIKGLTLDYTFLWHVNRIFGSESPMGDFEADTHLINAAYAFPFGTLTGYAYLVDLNDAPVLSSQTLGTRFSGGTPLNDRLSLLYTVEFANQQDYAGNPGAFDLNYYLVEGGVKWSGLTLTGAYEVLEGDGVRGFATPLATLHKFQGFADAFLTTPPDGIEDIQVTADYVFKDVPGLGKIRLAAWYHDFESQSGIADLGQEIDLGLFVSPWKPVTFSVEYADLFGATDVADRRRLFVTVNYKY